MSHQPHILVVDDSRDIRDLLVRFLEEQGFRATPAEDAAAARAVLQGTEIDLAVLDIMMPGEDGWSLCSSIRSETPVIMLSALGEDDHRIRGLELGADDYLAKPVNPRELAARINAVLRRSNAPSRSLAKSKKGKIRFDRWTLDIGRRELVSADELVVPLSAGEYRLLLAFLEHPQIALSREQLLEVTQGRSAEPFDRSIDNAVSRLRKKIEEDQKAPRLIKTLWGGGYMFTASANEE